MAVHHDVTEPRRPCILVVDDDQDTREMLDALLTGADYRTVLASSGEVAVAEMQREHTDLVLLDLGLPGIDGYEVCRRIRSSDQPDVPILMLTASQEPAGPARGLGLGADDYLRKPFDPPELLARLEALQRRDERARTLVVENEALREMIGGVQQQLTQSSTQAGMETTLRRELLHNVTVHLQALCRVIETEYRRQSFPEARDAVQRILGRARGVALVYETSEMLQDDPADVGALVRTIANALKNIYSPRKRVPLTIEGGLLQLPLMYAAPLAMIVNELVTNSFKHAFPSQRFGSITIRYGRDIHLFWLEVVDDGVGFDPARPAPGRGIPTVQTLVQQLGGRVTWESAGEGTRARVSMPLPTATQTT